MKKIEILVDHIFGENNVKYSKGDVVEVSDEVAAAFGERCKVIEAPKKVKKATKVEENEG